MRKRFSTHLSRSVLLASVLVMLSVAWAKQGTGVFDQLGLLVDVRHELVSGYVEEPDQQAITEAAVRGMVEALNDPYTTYLTAEELEPFNRYVSGSFSGIGAEIDLHENRPRIVTPLEDSPAWKAGVLAGDVILEIDGESTLDMNLTDAVQRLTGEAGTDVTIRVRHESGEEAEITITRDVINVQTVRGFQRDAEHHFDFLLDDVNRIGYVRITQFSERTAGELRQALTALEEAGARAVILDMRFNPGGLLQSAVEVSDMFLTEGSTIVSVKGRTVPEQTYASSSETLMPDIPVVVLANEASASAAEIVTGALADNDRALFVGTRTFGKGSVQQVKMLEGGQGALKLTNAYYYIPSGRLIHRRDSAEIWGVDPTEGSYIPMTPEEVREMLEVRREAEVLRQENGQNADTAVTPDWIRDELKDPQLAGALQAALGMLETGEWPQVGESNAEALVLQTKRQNLLLRRDLLQERLTQVEQELTELEEGGPVAADEGSTLDIAEDLDLDEASPTDPEAVRERVQQQQKMNLIPEAQSDEGQEQVAPELEPAGAGSE